MIRTLLFALLAASPAAAPLHTRTVLTEDEQVFINVYKAVSPSVVNITTTAMVDQGFFDMVPRQGAGSGVGYVSTEPHTFYISVESTGLSWTFSVEEGIVGEVVGSAR